MSLQDLPNELIIHILSYLDTTRPSKHSFYTLPQSKPTSSTPLKHFSLCSKRLRTLTLPILFRHAQITPATLQDALTFFGGNNITPSSALVSIESPTTHTYPPWHHKLPSVTTLQISAPPHIFAELSGLSLDMTDAWAFNMPRHILELHSTDTLSDGPLLCSRNWTGLGVNEGSSMTAYATYEYFFKKPPSLLANIQRLLSRIEPDAEREAYGMRFGPCADALLGAKGVLEGLREFSFVAVFPFYNHVDDILKCMRRMRVLERLFFQLCPQEGSSVLSDGLDEVQGHLDVRDLWTEVYTAYDLLKHTIDFLVSEGRLQQVSFGDLWNDELRDRMDFSTWRIFHDWDHDGMATWRKIAAKEERE